MPWPDFAKGVVQSKNLRLRSLDLHLPSGGRAFSRKSSGPFNKMLPQVVDLTLSAHWPYTVGWAREAFVGPKLQRLTLLGHSKFREEDHSFLLHEDGDESLSLSNQWGPVITVILEENATTLTYISIGSSLCLDIAINADVTFPALHTLSFLDVDFYTDQERFSSLMKPFACCRNIHTLQLDNCREIPESFSRWFDFEKGLWPAVKKLSMKQAGTFLGPGDDVYDGLEDVTREKMEEPDEDDGYWTSRSRIVLETNCEAKGIELESKWGSFGFC
ncbi:hypothetical protein DXG01_013377 [Tephrocybe rancida]|nr:hypothetical protein DXG01_013377 [Tephrocybe rancida]